MKRRYTEAELETTTIPRVPVLSEGGPYYGTGSPPEGDFYTKADLEAIVAANRELADEVRPPNKLGHSKEQRLLANSGLKVADDELPAAGWLDPASMVVEQAADGKWKIFTDVVRVPAKLARLFKAGAFRTRSVELSRIRSQESDGEKIYDNVITGLAWLGAKAPAVRTLEDVFALYADADADEDVAARVLTYLEADEAAVPENVTRTVEYLEDVQATIIWQPETGFQDLMCDLRAALNPGGTTRYWVSDVSIDLTAAIVSDYDGNKTWIVPFTLDESQEPTVSPATDWREAEQAWVAATDELTERNFGAGVRNREPAAYTDVVKTKALPKVTDEQIVELAKTFGLDGEGDELRDKVAAALGSPAVEETDQEPAVPGAVEATVEPVAAMSSEEIATLKTDAALGKKAYEERRVERREELLRANLDKFDPAELTTWREFYDAQPELAAKQLSALPTLPTLKTYGQDDPLPNGATAADAKAAADDVYAEYAAQTGVPRAVTTNG